jgi:hypothetical protein
MTMQCVFVNTEQKPIKEEVVGYFTTATYQGRKECIRLNVMKKVFYPHPDGPELMVFVYRDDIIGEFARSELEAAPLILLEAAQKNIEVNIEKFMR